MTGSSSIRLLDTPLNRAIALTVVLTVLTGCTSAKSISKAKDITDNGRDNVVLLSYDFTSDVFDRHPSVNNNNIDIKCSLPGDGTARPTCFSITLPYTGKTEEGNSVYHRFTKSDVQTFKLRYGEYPLERLLYSVVYDVRQEPYCYTNKKKRVVCSTRTERDYNRFNAELPEVVSFNVEAGAGCYLGHMKIRVVGNEVVDFELIPDMNPEIFDKLPDTLRDVTRAHVTKNCTPS